MYRAGQQHPRDTGVCETAIPPEKKTGWNISLDNTTSGARSQFLLLGRMAKAQLQGTSFFTGTGIWQSDGRCWQTVSVDRVVRSSGTLCDVGQTC